MWITKLLKFFASLAKKYFSKFSPKTKFGFFRGWKQMSPQVKDKIRKKALEKKEVQELKEKSQEELKRVLVKENTNKPLTTYEKDFLNNYQELFVNDKEPQILKYERQEFAVSNSSWIKTVIYYPDTKRVKLLIVNQKGFEVKWYNFYNVPKTKYLALVNLGGKFMWDYFGKHYSLNPYHWVRKNEVGKVRIRKVVRKYYGK